MDLIEHLESLRISDTDYFAVGYETECAYDRANDMLDECLEIVRKWIREHHLESIT